MPTPQRLIVIPSWSGHLPANERFLKSLVRHGRDAEGVAIRFILSDAAEVANLRGLPVFAESAARFDVEAHVFHDALRKAGVAEEWVSRATLDGMGKFSYQSLKKLSGLMAFPFDEALLMDAEAVFLRACSLNQFFADFFRAPVIFHSDNASPQTMQTTKASLSLLGRGDEAQFLKTWLFEYQGWFYTKDSFAHFSQHVQEKTGRSIAEHLITTKDVFETVAFNWFLKLNPHEIPGLRVVAAADALRKGFGDTRAGEILRLHRDLPWGTIENLLFALTPGRFRGYQRVLRAYGLRIIRAERNFAYRNTFLIWLFWKLTPEVKLLACSESAIGAFWWESLVRSMRHLREIFTRAGT